MESGNFAEMTPFLRHLGTFIMPQIYDMGPTSLLPLRRKACSGFFSRARAIPVARLGADSCQNRPKGWTPIHQCIRVNVMQVVSFSVIRCGSVSYPNGTQCGYKWSLISQEISAVNYIYTFFPQSHFCYYHIRKRSWFSVYDSSREMTVLTRRCEPFTIYAAYTLRNRWTRDHICNLQIPAVCSLSHRHTDTPEHQTWATHRYWFWLSPFWQHQSYPCRILSLVSTYFIIIYLVCAFSVVVFG
jgi:hypothetical protein